MNCPKCGAQFLTKNQDGDFSCLCGYILYQTSVVEEMLFPKPVKTKKSPPPTTLKDYEPGCTKEEFFGVLKKATKPTELEYALELLKADTIKAFSNDYGNLLSRYGQDAAIDAYYETLVERNCLDNMVKMLQYWDKYLRALPDSQERRGASLVLLTLSSLCSEVDQMNPDGSK